MVKNIKDIEGEDAKKVIMAINCGKDKTYKKIDVEKLGFFKGIRRRSF